MKPIIGQTSYKEIKPGEMALHLHRAEILRAQEMSESFIALGRGIIFGFKAMGRAIDWLFHSKVANVR